MINTFVLFFVCLWRLVDVKTVSLMEGDSVTLNTEVQKYMLIQWMFGSTRIAEIDKLTQTNSTYDGPAERFRDRLKLDQTGSLTITNTRTTDSGLYTATVINEETSYMSFNVTVYESPQSTSSPERSLSSVGNNLTVNQTEDANITELHQPCSESRPQMSNSCEADYIHCCGSTEVMIRLVLSALVGVATVAFLVYEVRSTRSQLNRMEERYHHQIHEVKSDHQYEMSRSFSSRYVC